ncbi:MAG: response regulator, partial [Spirochaetaceae bacterium]|nr:response regulator [Spirochaetaceae bacterium]
MAKAVILIIEDDPDIQEMLSFAMAKEGWKLLMAKSGEDGLALLKKEGAACIVLDIMLPGMDGFKVLKKLKLEEAFRGIPVIMTTARGEEADIVAGLELGADDYVVKPYSPKVLAARIRAALRRIEEPSEGIAEKTFWE